MISFIIPTLNEESTIEKILTCLGRYTGSKEIIVSDGGSTDQTVAIARRFADQVIIHDNSYRQTIGGGRNAGAQVAKGEYLVFFDADIYIENPDDFFNLALKIFENNSGTIALTGKLQVLKEFETRADRLAFGLVNIIFYTYNNILRVGAASGEFQMIRTDTFRAVSGFNPLLPVGEDMELFYRLGKKGRTRFISKLTVYHTGRRAHKIGWLKLLWSWLLNWFSVTFFKKSASDEWTVVR